MWLYNVNIIGSTGRQHIQVEQGKIKSISTDENLFQKITSEIKIEFENAIAFPGLINSHDHLDFNLFPQTGNRIYNNYSEWGRDIHHQNKKAIDGVLKIPKPLRIQWGIYKNLLNGVTTVVNHGAKLNISNSFITVLQNNYSLHSIQFEKNWKLKLNQPFRKKQPYVIHIGEGTDVSSHREIGTLIKWNLFNKSMIAVHGVAMNEEQAKAFLALVWCPATNYFLLGKTADIKRIKTKIPILFGTDSTLTADCNLWEHLRVARNAGMATDRELFEMLAKNPAQVWEQNNTGSIEVHKNADIVVARVVDKNGFDAFYSLNPEDILLVLHEGEIRLIDESFYNKLVAYDPLLKNFTRISVNGIYKYIHGNLSGLIKEIKKYNPNANMPVAIF